MPPSTHRLANGGVIRVWRGALGGADQVASAQQFLEIDDTGDVKYAIVDYRRVTSAALRPADARRVAEINRRLGPIRVAAIAPQDVVYGFGRMVELTRGDEAAWKVHVARTADEAIAWLEGELPDLDFTETRRVLDTLT